MSAAAAVTAAAVVLMFGYGPLFCAVVRWRIKRAEAERRRARAVEWTRLQAAVKQARADIAAEAEHFDMWEQEVSA